MLGDCRVIDFLRLRVLGLRWRQQSVAGHFPFDVAGRSNWYNGRAAIWNGVQRLGLEPGDRVLVPAYSCGAEIDSLIEADLTVDSYRCQPDLTPDFVHLAELCKAPAQAIMVTHYFGFPQPMSAVSSFARDHGLLIIEDTTHGLYSNEADGTPLGSEGDLGIFSFAKFMPVLDGGAFVLNKRAESSGPLQVIDPPSKIAIVGKLKGLLEVEMLRRAPKLSSGIKKYLLDPSIEFLKDRLDPNYQRAEPGSNMSMFGGRFLALDRARWGLSSLAGVMMRRTDHETIKVLRRQNYQTLQDLFDRGPEVRPLLRLLPPDCCPWVFPVWAENRDQLVMFLMENGVEAGSYWDQDHDEAPLDDFPFERSLR